jgi:energy-coupling factor transporter transmembrane protein EcfT
MANWSAPAPTNPEKPNWLHDQSELPAPPARSRVDYARILAPIVLGLAFTGALVALGFQSRASWDSHRDWVIPVTIPLLAIAGVAAGYLVARRAWVALGPVLLLLLLLCSLTALNVWRGAETEGSDALRDALSIMQGVLLGLTVASAIAAMVFVEWTRPTRPASAADG